MEQVQTSPILARHPSPSPPVCKRNFRDTTMPRLKQEGFRSSATAFFAAVVVVTVLSLPMGITLWLMGIDVPWLGAYIYPFFSATSSPDATSSMPASWAAIATLTEWTVVSAAYSLWLRRAPAWGQTFASALAAVVIMAVINFLCMGALGLSVQRIHIYT